MINTDVNKYLDWKAGHTQKAPIAYGIHLRRFARLVHKPSERVTVDDVVRFQYQMKQQYSLANVAYSTTVLKNFFKFLSRQGVQVIDPWLIKKPRFRSRPHYAVSLEDFQAMDKATREDEFFETGKKLVIQMLWYTGVRVSELYDLNISDVDIKQCRAMIATKKNTRNRWIFWPEETNRLLIKYLGVRLCLNQNPALFIAGTQGGSRERISIRTIQHWVKEIAGRAEIKNVVSPHSFRHGRGHRIIERGQDVSIVQQILGHSNPVSTFKYLQMSPREIEPKARSSF